MNAITNHPACNFNGGDHLTPISLPAGLASEPLSDLQEQRTLRRTGRKPVRFTGRQVIQAVGKHSACGMWYDLNIYRTAAEAVIVELAARRAGLNESDLTRVEVFVSISTAATWLQSYQCAADVPVPASMSDFEMPLACAVVQAVRLRQSVLRVEDEFHGLLSDVFAALGLADDVETVLATDADDARPN